MTLADYQRQNPRVHIAGEAGDFLLVVCDCRAWRYTTLADARRDAADSCGLRRCAGPQYHRIIELQAPAPPKLSSSYRRMVESA